MHVYAQEVLPKVKEEPLPEGLLWLLLTGRLPTPEQAKAVTEDLRARSKLPPHVLKVQQAGHLAGQGKV